MLERFLSLVERDPHHLALVDAATGAQTSRVALRDRARVLAAELRAAGVAEGDGIAIQLPNSSDFVAAFLAALQLRLVAVPVDRDAADHEVAALLEQFAIRALVHRGGISVRSTAARPDLPPFARLIKLTSGSTGRAKGVVTSEENLLADCTNICRSMDIRPDDVNLGAIPFSHSYGFSNLVTPLIVSGTTVVMSNVYLPQTLIELANHYRCTVAPLIPMVFEHLATAAAGSFETVRTFISAGAPLPVGTSRRFRERFGTDIHSFFGCSECGGISYDRPGAAVERGTVGAALDGVELSLDGNRVRVQSASVALGYLLDAKTYEPIRDFFADDLVEMRGGEVALIGRASDLINTAGKKVNPREVEAILLQIDGVREAKVYGEEAGARGEVVAAVVVASPDVTRETIRAFCRTRLAAHKVPRIVKLIDAMPLDERGKVKRAALATL